MMDSAAHILGSQVDGLVHHYTVALHADNIEQLVSKRLRQIQKTAQIKGFRRGKAPLKIIRNHHGNRITNAIVDRYAIDVASRLIAEKALQPVSRPTIDIIHPDGKADSQLQFTLTLEVMPEVALKSDSPLKITRYRVNEPIGQAHCDLIRQHEKRQIFDQLIADYDFAIPAEMVKREQQRIVQGYRETVAANVPRELEAEFQTIAERRIRLAIVLTEIGRQHHIHIPKQEVERLVEAQAAQDPEHETDIVNYYLEHPSALVELQSTLFEDRVVDYLLSQAQIEEQQVTAEQLMAMCQAE